MNAKAKYCPLRRDKCLPGCMWLINGTCAVAHIAQQAHRQGDELYAMTEVMMHGADNVQSTAEGQQDE